MKCLTYRIESVYVEMHVKMNPSTFVVTQITFPDTI